MAMSIIELIFFVYTFLSIYMLSLFVILYLQSRKEMFSYPKGKVEPVSIVMPCYNEQKNIGLAIESLLNLKYPKDMLEIIIVDDKSTDNSVNIVRNYEKKYKNVRLIVNKRNSGGAAEPTNIGIKAAKYDYVAVADSDSTPDKDALLKMIGFLQQDEKVGGVTCSIQVKHRSKLIEKLQAMEYTVIAFTRKLLDTVDSVYVTPGPFALYKKSVLMEIGLFDVKNMTQDIEIVWRMLKNDYKARMCLSAKVHSVAPKTWKGWWKQRIRWNIGGTQTLLKHKSLVLRKGMLGLFIIPIFAISLFIGLIGLGLFTYLFIRRIMTYYLTIKYSAAVETAIFTFNDFNLSLSILNFFGISLFILGTLFVIMSFTVLKEKELRNNSKFALLIFLTIYLAIYPINLIVSLYKLTTGKYSW